MQSYNPAPKSRTNREKFLAPVIVRKHLLSADREAFCLNDLVGVMLLIFYKRHTWAFHISWLTWNLLQNITLTILLRYVNALLEQQSTNKNKDLCLKWKFNVTFRILLDTFFVFLITHNLIFSFCISSSGFTISQTK